MEVDDVVRTPAGDGEEIGVGGGMEAVDGPAPVPAEPLSNIMEGLAARDAPVESVPDVVPVERAPVDVPVEVAAEIPAETAEGSAAGEVEPGAKAAAALVEEYRKLPGIVGELVRGNSVEEVVASLEAARSAYDAVKQAVLREQSAGVPKARSGAGPAPVPGTPLGMIEAGLATAAVRRQGSRV